MTRRSELPLAIFDTNVAAALKTQSDADRARFWRWLLGEYRYAISPLVLAEILKSLRDDPDGYLEHARRDFYALRGPGKPIMLPLPAVFLRRTLFGIEGEHPHVTARDMAEVLEAGRRMKRVYRRKGQVLLVENVEYRVIVLDYLIDPILEGEHSMFDSMEATREQKAAPLGPEEWAKHILAAADVEVTDEKVRRVAESCKAAYALQRFLWEKVPQGYNAEKHRGDWMDLQLLLYQADPHAVFVTNEKQLPRRIHGCGQEDRVLPFNHLWSQAQSEAE